MLWWKVADAGLAVGGLASPAVLIFWTIGDEQQQAGRSKALDQAVEQCLGLAVGPVKILDREDDGVLASLPQQHTLHRVERPLAARTRIECGPRAIVGRHVEEGQQRGQRGFQSSVEGEQLGPHILSDGPEIVTVPDLEVVLEEIDHRQVARLLSIRDGGALQEPPALHRRRMGEFVDDARLTAPGFSHDGHHLTVALSGTLLSTTQQFQFGVAPDEGSEATAGARLETCLRGSETGHFIDLDRIGKPLHGHRAEWSDLDEPFDERERGWRDDDAFWSGELLHPRGQVRRLS